MRCADNKDIKDPFQNFDSSDFCPKNISKSLPSSLEGENKFTPFYFEVRMLSCDQAMKWGYVSENCFMGSTEDPDYDVLNDLWKNRNKIKVFIYLHQEQVMLQDKLLNITRQSERIYAGPFFQSEPQYTDLYMEKTHLDNHNSFLLGSFGSATQTEFYRSERRTSDPASNNITIFAFTLSLNQRTVTYTRYSLINFLIIVPPLLLTAYRITKAFTAKISNFNFELTIFNRMYRAIRKKDNKSRQGPVKLTTTQYLRLICAV